jgi:hypothetical protein
MPRPRKVQATARRDAAPAPPSASAPIFRRAKEQISPPKPAAAEPAASAGWKPPARPGSPGRPAWKPAAKPPAGGVRWGGKDRGMPGGGKPRPAAGSRPSFVPGRSATRPYVRPGAAPSDTRSARRPESRGTARPNTRGTARPNTRGTARPNARGGARPNTRPDAWSGTAKREQPKPWALPGRKSSSAPRPPRAGGRRDSPFRPAQKHPERPNDRPNPATTPPFPPLAPRGERGPGDPSRVRSTPGRPPRHAADRTPRPPSAYGAKRSPVPYRSAQGRSGERRSDPSPRGGQPSGPRPPRFDKPRRPFPRADGPAGPRPPSARGADRAYTKPSAGPSRNDRPRPAGYARPGGKPGSGGGDQGRGDRGPRPPFVPGARPGKAWPRAGGSSAKPGAKPGKPSAGFRGRKPDRKKPGA